MRLSGLCGESDVSAKMAPLTPKINIDTAGPAGSSLEGRSLCSRHSSLEVIAAQRRDLARFIARRIEVGRYSGPYPLQILAQPVVLKMDPGVRACLCLTARNQRKWTGREIDP